MNAEEKKQTDEQMREAANVLKRHFGSGVCFVILAIPFGEDPSVPNHVNYISNGRREDIKPMLAEMVRRWGTN